ncbi:MAG: bestrophin family ion channel [Rhizonema sp. NSF051]|nr:bestrophin family ion channel [Rhizonema sp. NSF051]
MKSEKRHWFKFALQTKGSVIPIIAPRVIWTGLFGVFVSILYYYKLPVSQPFVGGVVPSIVLGLLLVFRTNTAYERFWEGRRLWGMLTSDIRNLAWQIWVVVNEVEPEDRVKKIAALRLVTAFAVASKLYLRAQPVNRELEALVSPSQYLQLKNIDNSPLEIAHWIGSYIQQQYNRNCITNAPQVAAMLTLTRNLMDSLGNCERILRAPLPLAYAIHLKQLVLIYCLLLPFQLVKDAGLWTGMIVALISFTLFGIEEIGIEIENPFGYDANDLPLDTICDQIKDNVEEFINLNSSSEYDNQKLR